MIEMHDRENCEVCTRFREVDQQRVILKSQILEKLKELGDTEHTISRRLKRKQIKGIRQNTHSCPIAQFLQQEFPGKNIRVTSSTVDISNETACTIFMPGHITDFIRSFDSGHWPSLELRKK